MYIANCIARDRVPFAKHYRHNQVLMTAVFVVGILNTQHTLLLSSNLFGSSAFQMRLRPDTVKRLYTGSFITYIFEDAVQICSTIILMLKIEDKIPISILIGFATTCVSLFIALISKSCMCLMMNADLSENGAIGSRNAVEMNRSKSVLTGGRASQSLSSRQQQSVAAAVAAAGGGGVMTMTTGDDVCEAIVSHGTALNGNTIARMMTERLLEPHDGGGGFTLTVTDDTLSMMGVESSLLRQTIIRTVSKTGHTLTSSPSQSSSPAQHAINVEDV
jgi:hypothetical protein